MLRELPQAICLLIPASLVLQTEEDITVNADILLGFESELNAGGNITLNRLTQSLSNIQLGADDNILIKGTDAFILTSGGPVELTAGNAISMSRRCPDQHACPCRR